MSGAPISISPKSTMSLIESDQFSIVLKDNANRAVLFGSHNAVSNDADTQHISIVLPLTNGKSPSSQNQYLSLLSMGYFSANGALNNPDPRLGEAMWADNYASRCVTVFPPQKSPDAKLRVQSYSARKKTGYSLLNPGIQGICIVPDNTVALVYYKPGWNNSGFGTEVNGMAMVFALDKSGDYTHILNQTAQNDYKASFPYGQIGCPGFVLGKSLNSQTAIGLSTRARVFDGMDPFQFESSQCLFKKMMFFDKSRHDLDGNAFEISSTWQQSAGVLNLDTKNPSSSWLSVSTDGTKVTIRAGVNLTGAPRQGVANLRCSLNDVSYTILVNQEIYVPSSSSSSDSSFSSSSSDSSSSSSSSDFEGRDDYQETWSHVACPNCGALAEHEIVSYELNSFGQYTVTCHYCEHCYTMDPELWNSYMDSVPANVNDTDDYSYQFYPIRPTITKCNLPH